MTTPISRRQFATLLGLGTAVGALRPSLVLAKPLEAPAPPKSAADGIVRLSSNENPYGPSPAALDAMRESLDLAWRYPDETEKNSTQRLDSWYPHRSLRQRPRNGIGGFSRGLKARPISRLRDSWVGELLRQRAAGFFSPNSHAMSTGAPTERRAFTFAAANGDAGSISTVANAALARARGSVIAIAEYSKGSPSRLEFAAQTHHPW